MKEQTVQQEASPTRRLARESVAMFDRADWVAVREIVAPDVIYEETGTGGGSRASTRSSARCGPGAPRCPT